MAKTKRVGKGYTRSGYRQSREAMYMSRSELSPSDKAVERSR